VAGGFQLLTRSKFAPWLRRLHATPVEVRLSGPAMETLAVIAYRQPVLRADIEAIRGVQSGEVLRQLIERDMVRIVGRSDELGRPFLYGTGKRFLQVFGLRHLDELPSLELSQGVCEESSREPSEPGRPRPRSTQPGKSQPESLTELNSNQNGEPGVASSGEAVKNIPKPFIQFPEAEEEKNVKTLTITKARPEFVAEESLAALMEHEHGKPAPRKAAYNQIDEDDEEFEEEDEDEDFEDEEFDDLDDDDEEEDEEEEDEELDDEWEEVEDEEGEDDEDDEDDDWDDEDWDDDDWDDDDDEDEDEDEEEEED
jgi:segregation and condensation protein B